MSHVSLWTRMGQWFKWAGGERLNDDSLPGIPAEGLPGDNGPGTAGDNGETTESGGLLARRRPREQAIEKLQEGYEQVVGLMGSIQAHLARQDQRTDQMALALTRLAETTSRLPEAAEQQCQQLGTIAAQLEASNDRARRWEQTLSELPQLAEAQRETLCSIGRELEASRESDTRISETLGGLRDAVHTLGECSSASSATLQELHEVASHRDETLQGLMREQNRRFVWLFVVTLVLAVAAIATGVAALF